MAVDTRDERASILLYALPFPGVFPNADGTIDHTDYEHITGLYDGIGAGGPGHPVMRRWGGVPHLGGGQKIGRSW